MIPKIIHYCWFGPAPLPEAVEKCIESWKRFAPDMEIKLWNESNYDVTITPYTAEAYEAGKFAFVTDYVRLDVVNTYGGIYLDTDVELIQSIDHLLEYDAFMALEQPGRVATGLGFGAIANHPIIQKNLEQYKNRNFIKNGNLDTTTCVTITMDTLNIYFPHEKDALSTLNTNWYSKIENFAILAPHVMCPYNLETGKTTILEDTVSIHHYDMSWKTHKDYLLKLKIKLRRWIGNEFYEKLKRIIK